MSSTRAPNRSNNDNNNRQDPRQVIWPKFSTHTRISGQIIHGSIHIDLMNAQNEGVENVWIKLRGQALSKITVSTGQSSSTHRQNIPLIRSDLKLWSRSQNLNIFPSNPNSNSISIPFSFQLPNSLPPSFYSTGMSRSGKISYGIQIVAERPGIFKFNRKLPVLMFGIVPKGEKEVVRLRRRLIQDSLEEERWKGEWRSIKKQNSIREHGIFGGQGHACFELFLPAIQIFPTSTPIPFILTVTTHTKTLKKRKSRSQHSQQQQQQQHDLDHLLPEPYNPNSKESIFPTISTSPSSAFSLRLDRFVQVYAKTPLTTTINRKIQDDGVAYLSGIKDGNNGSDDHDQRVKVVAAEPVWIPGKEDGKGKWKREIRFEGTFMISHAPTFVIENMKCAYFLHVKVPFPGIGNDLKTEIPIVLASGFETPSSSAPGPAPQMERSNHFELDHDYNNTMPPPELDIPPGYFNDHEDWDYEEKR